jgi:hypothetical protein
MAKLVAVKNLAKINQQHLVTGTTTQGIVVTNQRRLTEVFGAPEEQPDATSIGWMLEFETAQSELIIATISTRVDPTVPSLEWHIPLEWQVGGFDKRALDIVQETVDG